MSKQKIAMVQIQTLAVGKQISLNGAQFFTITEFKHEPFRYVKLVYNGTEKTFIPEKQVYTKSSVNAKAKIPGNSVFSRPYQHREI